MKLSNIVSKDLLPDFAESISWVMNALDSIIQVIKARSVSIDAPLTMESIEALTDEELQALYAQYGLALYYPDISRARRNWMLYNMARIWRYLGTPKAVEFLCQYIFSDIDIELKVHDNGAFDAEGRLVNPDLVDVFDIEIIPGVTILPPEANQRILENVIRFSRNSQALRQIYYSYDTFVTQTVSSALPYNGIVAVENVLNEAVCEDSPEPPTPPGPENEDLTLYLPTSTKYVQINATSATTQISKYYGSDTVCQLYTDENRTIPFVPDLTKIYRRGYYNPSDLTQWIEVPIQSIEDLPATTTNILSESEGAYTMLDSGLMWSASNYNTGLQNAYESMKFRVYPDNREWTTETLYLEAGTKQYQPGITCYSSPTPNTAGTAYKQLYTDSSCTTKFYYDLDRDYLAIFGDGEIRRIQSIWDMPTTTGAGYLATMLYKTGFVYFITNSNYVSSTTQTSILFKSTPKQYDEPTITLDLGFANDFLSRTFSSNDYWFACIRNPIDEQKAIDFGVDLTPSSNGVYRVSATIMNHFNVEMVALCDAYENTVITNMSNFFVSTSNGLLVIRSVNAYATATNYWRVRITKKQS